MTPEQTARFILIDCQDPELKAISERENSAALAEASKDPDYKAAWDANMKKFADAIDDRIAADVYAQVYGK